MGSMAMCLIGLLIRAEERRNRERNVQMFKCSLAPFFHIQARTLLYKSPPPNGATNTGNININYDEGVMVVNNLKI